jgi:hypothetical protein
MRVATVDGRAPRLVDIGRGAAMRPVTSGEVGTGAGRVEVERPTGSGI